MASITTWSRIEPRTSGTDIAVGYAALGTLAAVSVAVMLLGYLFFVRLKPWFAKLI